MWTERGSAAVGLKAVCHPRAPTVAYSQEIPLKSGHRVPISAWA